MKLKALSPLSKRLIYALTIVVGIVLDQLTKFLAVKYLEPVKSIPLWQDVFHLTYVENRGAAFGMLASHPWVFMTFSTVAILILGVYLFVGTSYLSDKGEDGKYPELGFLSGISLAFIVTGGIGNMIDRVATRVLYETGFVVDFLDFTLINFAVFNVADCFVTVGAVMLAVSLMLPMLKSVKKEK